MGLTETNPGNVGEGTHSKTNGGITERDQQEGVKVLILQNSRCFVQETRENGGS